MRRSLATAWPAALVVCGLSCAEADSGPPRRVVPLVSLAAYDARAAVLDERPDEQLAPGERLTRSVRVEPGLAYTLSVDFEGAPPALLGGPGEDGSLAPLHVVPGRAVGGWKQVVFYPAHVESVVEVHATGGALRLRSLALRPWGAERGAAFAAGANGADGANGAAGAAGADGPDALEGLEVFGDHRLARRLGPGRAWELPATVPVNATRLVFDLTPDPMAPVDEAPTPGLRVSVRLLADGEEHVLVDRPAPGQRTSWETVSVDVPSWAGRSVAVRIECAATQDTAAAAPGLAVSVPEWVCETGRTRPNLVLISLDTLRPDHLGFHGYARDTSPLLDALAARSVVFEQAFSTAPYTLPSHASLLSGQYPTTHGVEHPAHALDIGRTPLLAAVLRAEGYATRAFTGGGYLNADFGFAHGFARYAHSDPTVPREGPVVDKLRASRWGRAFLAARRAQGWDAARAWVRRHGEVPFFLFVQTYGIHDYRPSGPHRGMFGSQQHEGAAVEPMRNPADQLVRPYSPDERRQLVDLYDEAIHGVDAEVGRLLAALEELGRDTVVAVTSDHGEVLGEHLLEGRAVVGHGMSLWEGLLRVPLVIHVPGVAPRRVTQRVSSVDVAPTLLDMLGVVAPESMQGRSLRPLLEGGGAGEADASPVLTELHSHRGDMRAYYAGDLKLVTGDPGASVTWPVGAARRLYDLSDDPLELDDLDEQRRPIAERLEADLELIVDELRGQRSGGPRQALLDEETRRRLVELGYVDGG